jgi:hypothetical protein
VYVYFIVVV